MVLVWAAIASGAWRYWLVASCFLVIGGGVAAWLASQILQRQLTWKRTALDKPVLLLGGFILIQLLIGNHALVAWALGPSHPITVFAPDFPAPFLAVGSVMPRQTLESGLIFAGYVAVYYLVVHAFSSRAQFRRLIIVMVILGAALASVGLLEYMTRQRWLTNWLSAWRDYEDTRRLASTWANPDHFGAWLAMLILLALGWVAGRSGHGAGGLLALRTAEFREDFIRRYLPMLAVVVMSLALVFTLSRGAVIGLAAGLIVFLILLGATGRARRSALLAGVLLVSIATYGAWIGFGPVLERFGSARESTVERGVLYLAALPMLRDFPLLGVGFGAFGNVYFRYQPAAHQAGVVYFPYAHNDLLQLVLELGAPGTALCLFLAWRLVMDLVHAHLLGRGACPVGGGRDEEALRHNRWSVGVAIGCLSGAAALTAHSVFDFSARIPANGFVAATLLGIATVVLHTRFTSEGEEFLIQQRGVALLGTARAIGAAVIALLLIGTWTLYWARAAARSTLEVDVLYETSLPKRRELAERLLRLDPWSPRGLNARAYDNYQAALAIWSGPPPNPDTRRATASALLTNVRHDLRAALTVMPTNPFLHNSLAWAEATDATVNDRPGAIGLAPALTYAMRAVGLASDNAGMYESVARISYSVPEVSLRAAQEALRRNPTRLEALVDLYLPLGLTELEWLALVPETGPARLELASVLEKRRLREAALVVYKAAGDVAPSSDRSLYRWALASALLRQDRINGAVGELKQALGIDRENPELHTMLGEALARREDATATEHFRAAVAASERPDKAGTNPFAIGDARSAAWLQGQLGQELGRPTRYRRVLARQLLSQRLWKDAAAEWERLARELPQDSEAQYGLGLALDGMGISDGTLARFRRAVELAPSETRFREGLAQRLWDSDQYYQAIKEWETLREQSPKHVPARLALARAYERVGQRADAYKEYRAILAFDTNQADAIRAIARLDGRR